MQEDVYHKMNFSHYLGLQRKKIAKAMMTTTTARASMIIVIPVPIIIIIIINVSFRIDSFNYSYQMDSNRRSRLYEPIMLGFFHGIQQAFVIFNP